MVYVCFGSDSVKIKETIVYDSLVGIYLFGIEKLPIIAKFSRSSGRGGYLDSIPWQIKH